MRLASTFVLSALSAILLPASASVSRTPHDPSHKHAAIASRQHREPRAELQLCVSITGDIFADTAGLLGHGSLLEPLLPLRTFANLNLCLCLKDLEIFLETDVNARVLVGRLGKDAVREILNLLITTSPNSRQCNTPPHAHNACRSGDPCYWECDEPWHREGNRCVCSHPHTLCNGHCGQTPNICGSAVPRPRKPRSGPIDTYEQAKATCKSNESVCGIAGREGTFDFECVDTDTALDSCGGCMTPHSFPDDNQAFVQGQDCSRLNALEFGCYKTSTRSGSHCIVHRCKEGFSPSTNRDECRRGVHPPSHINLVQSPSPNHNFHPVLNPGSGVNQNPNRCPMMRMRKDRRPRPTGNGPAHGTIDPLLSTKLGIAIDAVITLYDYCQTLPQPGTPAPGYPSQIDRDLIAPVVQALANILTSTSASVIVDKMDAQIDAITQLQITLQNCNCVERLGLQAIEEEATRLLETSTDMRNWCDTHPIVNDAPSGGSVSAPGRNPPSRVPFGTSSIDLTIYLTRLCWGDIQDSGSSVNSDAPVPAEVVVDADLQALVDQLVASVAGLKLESHTFRHPHTGGSGSSSHGPSSRSQNLIDVLVFIDAIVDTTANIVSAFTESSLVIHTTTFVEIVVLFKDRLDKCGCVGPLGLGTSVSLLSNVTDISLNLRDWCDSHPHFLQPENHDSGSGASSQPMFPRCSDYLTSLGFGNLEIAAHVGGYGGGFSGDLTKLLAGLALGRGGPSDDTLDAPDNLDSDSPAPQPRPPQTHPPQPRPSQPRLPQSPSHPDDIPDDVFDGTDSDSDSLPPQPHPSQSRPTSLDVPDDGVDASDSDSIPPQPRPHQTRPAQSHPPHSLPPQPRPISSRPAHPRPHHSDPVAVILIYISTVIDGIIRVRLGGHTLIISCGSSPSHTPHTIATNAVESIIFLLNNVLHETLNLGEALDFGVGSQTLLDELDHLHIGCMQFLQDHGTSVGLGPETSGIVNGLIRDLVDVETNLKDVRGQWDRCGTLCTDDDRFRNGVNSMIDVTALVDVEF